MTEIVVEIPEEVDERTLTELKKEIESIVKFSLVRKLLLKKWNRTLSKSELTKKDALRLSKKVNKEAFKLWKEKGWILR